MLGTEEERREARRPYYMAAIASIWAGIGLFTLLSPNRKLLGASQLVLGATFLLDDVLRRRGSSGATRIAVKASLCAAAVLLLLAHALR